MNRVAVQLPHGWYMICEPLYDPPDQWMQILGFVYGEEAAREMLGCDE